jgi:CDP-glucose 4,6-dehydratase
MESDRRKNGHGHERKRLKMGASDFWKGKPVFVTGGTGFLGGWVIRRLIERGAEVVALVRDSVPRSMLMSTGDLSRINSIQGSVEDAGLLRRSFSEYSIDTVLHLAAQPLVGVAKLDPVGTFEANIKGTWNVLEAARQTRVNQVIVASSDKAYGESRDLPYKESHPLQGRYPYDCSKSCADLIAQMYQTTYDMAVSVVRCANLFGGGDLNFSRTIPGCIKATLENTPFVIRSDGHFIRDFLYIKDAADAYLHLAEAVAHGAPNGPYNFSLEVKWSVLDCVDQILTLMKRKDLEPVILNQASAEIREQYMNCDNARQVLNWKPAYSSADALKETIAWYESHFRETSALAAGGAR